MTTHHALVYPPEVRHSALPEIWLPPADIVGWLRAWWHLQSINQSINHGVMPEFWRRRQQSVILFTSLHHPFILMSSSGLYPVARSNQSRNVNRRRPLLLLFTLPVNVRYSQIDAVFYSSRL